MNIVFNVIVGQVPHRRHAAFMGLLDQDFGLTRCCLLDLDVHEP